MEPLQIVPERIRPSRASSSQTSYVRSCSSSFFHLLGVLTSVDPFTKYVRRHISHPGYVSSVKELATAEKVGRGNAIGLTRTLMCFSGSWFLLT